MSTRIAILTDVHANLPALEAALAAIHANGISTIYHTGDAIGIGPFPAEVLDRLLHTPRIRLIMGNHDALFAYGLASPPPRMSEGELEHTRWTHDQLDPGLASAVASWPWRISSTFYDLPVTFTHYALDGTGRDFATPADRHDPDVLDRLFAPSRARLVFYGHHHYPSVVTREVVGSARYVNPDALGCSPTPIARYALLEVNRDKTYHLSFHAAPYDFRPLFQAFEERAVPERAFIQATFFGQRRPN